MGLMHIQCAMTVSLFNLNLNLFQGFYYAIMLIVPPKVPILVYGQHIDSHTTGKFFMSNKAQLRRSPLLSSKVDQVKAGTQLISFLINDFTNRATGEACLRKCAVNL
jgi:hypothetical protein